MRYILFLAVMIAACARVGLAQSPAESPPDQESPKPVQESSPELTAIRAGSDAFVAAFNKHDAKAMAALWTEDAEFIDDSGSRHVGQDAIEQTYAAFFAENSASQIQMVIDSLRLVSDTVAIEDGRALVEPAPAGAPGVSKYTAVHVKVDGKWLMASVRDTWIETPVTRQSVADLGWLIGNWAAEEHGVQFKSVCRWVADESFVERTYTTKQLDGTTTSGVQLIGWNPLEGHVQSWSFSPGGGHSIGMWSLDQDGWTAQIMGVTGDGIPTASINQLTRIDENAYVWQSNQRTLGGDALPDTGEIVIKRQSATR